MLERTEGIILRTRPFTETSLVVHWLTHDLGRIQTVAKGARRVKSPFAGKLDLFFEADFSFQRSRRSELHVLGEVSVRDFRRGLRREIAHLQQAAYFTQLIELMTETEAPIRGVFHLFRETLNALPQQVPTATGVLAFEAKLLRELGLDPNAESRGLTPGAQKILNKMTELSVPMLKQLRPTSAQSEEIGQWLQGLIGSNAGRVPASRAVAMHY